ncbi:UNVERIFIED_ORG: hypothetical protein J2Y94_005243 [Pseudomonas poae]
MSNQATAHSVTFKRPDGAEVNGYLASPAVLEGAPAIVLIQEWWGLNEQIKGVAIRLAECGTGCWCRTFIAAPRPWKRKKPIT